MLMLLLLPPWAPLQVSSARAALESADLPGQAEQLQEKLVPAAEQVRMAGGFGFDASAVKAGMLPA